MWQAKLWKLSESLNLFTAKTTKAKNIFSTLAQKFKKNIWNSNQYLINNEFKHKTSQYMSL